MNRPQSTPDKLVSLIRRRAAAGLQKYGVTVDRNDLTTSKWLDHAIEEMIDGAQYLLRVKDHIDSRPAADAFSALQKRVQTDPMYAAAWHNSIESAIYDCGVEHATAHRAAARFMSQSFGVENTLTLCNSPKIPARASIRAIVAGAIYDFAQSGLDVESFITESGLSSSSVETAWKPAMQSWARTEPLEDECDQPPSKDVSPRRTATKGVKYD